MSIAQQDIGNYIDAARELAASVAANADDWERVHACRVGRRRGHGSIVVKEPGFSRYDLARRENAIGLGFEDPATGELTHGLYGVPEHADGPWWIVWMAFRTPEQFRDLFVLIKSLADQLKLVRIIEPPGIQMQSLLRRPIRRRLIGEGGKHDATSRVLAWWQARIVDLPACMAATQLPAGESVTFHLKLADPITEHLSAATRERWSGVAGDWTVTLGPESHAERAPAVGLPVLETSVNTFTRLWLGVARPSDLAYIAPDLHAPAELLDQLERVLRLPKPCPDWDI